MAESLKALYHPDELRKMEDDTLSDILSIMLHNQRGSPVLTNVLEEYKRRHTRERVGSIYVNGRRVARQ